MKPLHTPIWFLAYWNGLPMLDFRRLGGFVRYARRLGSQRPNPTRLVSLWFSLRFRNLAIRYSAE